MPCACTHLFVVASSEQPRVGSPATCGSGVLHVYLPFAANCPRTRRIATSTHAPAVQPTGRRLPACTVASHSQHNAKPTPNNSSSSPVRRAAPPACVVLPTAS
eukprot:scaffold10838_cov99-Isochrysis_galbana.AAC.1